MEPINEPVVNTRLEGLNNLQRVMECFRYTILCIEHWICPDGHLREWLRRILLLCAWLIVPAIFVMPVVGFILWQVSGWLSMLTGIVGKLVLVLGLFIVLRIVTAFLKR